jgi:hypothetical protein
LRRIRGLTLAVHLSGFPGLPGFNLWPKVLHQVLLNNPALGVIVLVLGI